MANDDQKKISNYLVTKDAQKSQNGGPSQSSSNYCNEISINNKNKRKKADDALFDEDLKSICLGIRDSVDDIKLSISGLNHKVASHDTKINLLEDRINLQQQKLLNCEMEISGFTIQENVEVKPYELLVEILHKFEITCERHEIIDVFIKWRQTENKKSALLIVTFAHERIKKRIMASKFKFQKTHKDKQSTIFFNERLTGFNRSIISEAKKLKRANKLLKVWTNNGQVYVLKDLNSEPTVVKNIQQVKLIANLRGEVD